MVEKIGMSKCLKVSALSLVVIGLLSAANGLVIRKSVVSALSTPARDNPVAFSNRTLAYSQAATAASGYTIAAGILMSSGIATFTAICAFEKSTLIRRDN